MLAVQTIDELAHKTREAVQLIQAAEMAQARLDQHSQLNGSANAHSQSNPTSGFGQ